MAQTRRRAFTLIELLVVVFIVGLVALVVLSAIQQQRTGGCGNRRTHCKNNLKQLGLAMHNYHDAWGCYPPGLVNDDDDPAEALHTGFLLLLPFLEETALYNAYNFKAEAPLVAGGGIAPDAAGAGGASLRGWANPANSTVVSKQLAQFYCPSNRNEGLVELGSPTRLAGATDYAMASGAIPLLCSDRNMSPEVARLRGYFGPNSNVKVKDVRDGTSCTVAMGEVAGGDQMIGTANVNTWKPTDGDALGKNPSDPRVLGVKTPSDPRPWGVD